MPTKNKDGYEVKLYAHDGSHWTLLSGLEDVIECLENPVATPVAKRVIFNDPATIVFWQDGTKTIVKCSDRDSYDKKKGVAMCFVKKMFGNSGKYYDIFKQWCLDEKEAEDN